MIYPKSAKQQHTSEPYKEWLKLKLKRARLTDENADSGKEKNEKRTFKE